MNEAEFFRHTLLETCKPDLLEKYRNTQRTIQRAISASLEPSQYAKHDSTSSLGLSIFRHSELPNSAQDKLDPENPITKAAMLIGAVSLRAWVYRNPESVHENKSFEDIWKGTRLQNLARLCDEVVADIVPETNGKFVSIDLQKMHNAYLEDLHSNTPEHIVLTGLNATGKSFLIGLLSEYLVGCDIPVKIIKTPRPKGPLARVIREALAGNLEFRRNALQLAFLSDALDISPEPETLMVFDRHPRIDAYVYGPSQTARTVLSTHEVFGGIYHTFIIDQHPLACAIRVAERDRSPRIFEQDTEAMTEQLLRFARLTVLPGIHWINNDIPDKENDKQFNWNLQISAGRFIGAVYNNGVLQRYLIRQGRFQSFREASKFLWLTYLPYQEKWAKTIKAT